MRILYLSTPFFADCDFPLIKALQNSGHDVTYLIMLNPYSLKTTLFDINKQIPENAIVPAVRYPELRVFKSYMDMDNVYVANRTVKQDLHPLALLMTLKIISFISKGKFDVVHTDCMLGMYNLMLYKLFGNKIVLTVHDPFPHTGEVNARKTFNYKMAMRWVKHFVLLNQKQKDEFCKKYNLNPNRILVNRLGIYDNILRFAKPLCRHEDHKLHDVLFFGRISPYKGVEYLCHAMDKVREVVPDATLTIAGGGKMYFDISPYMSQDWVCVHNRYIGLEELADLLQNCAITVCPYTDATQSGVIMTSYAMCRPVVASNAGGLGEMVEDGKTGLLVSPKNIDELADAIISLLKDNVRRQKMQEYIESEYFEGAKSWKAIANKYVKYYNSFY